MHIFESLLVFLNREYNSYSAQHILTRKYWQEYYTFFKDVIVEKKVACANFSDSRIEIEM